MGNQSGRLSAGSPARQPNQTAPPPPPPPLLLLQSTTPTSFPYDAQPDTIRITINSMMAKTEPRVVVVRKEGTVRDMKIAYHRHAAALTGTEQAWIYNNKELSDDDATLVSVGITQDCSVNLSMRMESGLRSFSPPPPPTDASIIIVTPNTLMPALSANLPVNLNEALREMQQQFGVTLDAPLSPRPPPPSASALTTPLWTPAKQMEHEVTRNRMRDLLKRKRRERSRALRALGVAADVSTEGDFGDTGSICGSVGRSPLGSGSDTPTEDSASTGSSVQPEGLAQALNAAARAAANGGVSPIATDFAARHQREVNAKPVTDKELRLYFDPPESATDMEGHRRDLFDPPQNATELEKVRSHMAKIERGVCGVCRKRLRISQQTQVCKCGRAFCYQHTAPSVHHCTVDYKNADRTKLTKEMPKMSKKPHVAFE